MSDQRPDVHPPADAVREIVARALAEDLGPLGDVTSALLPPDSMGAGSLVARADGVLAGRRCVEETFSQVDGSLRTEWHTDDGARVSAGETLATVRGPLRSLLTAERTALNLLCHLSGVATLTRRYVDAVSGAGAEAEIIDTRKTTPGLRLLEKAAVRAGGGRNHRTTLSDMVLIKDNHLPGLGISAGVAAARRRWPGHRVEVECDSAEQVAEAVDAGADVVMLDNMDPATVRRCVQLVAGRCPLEVSGRVNLDTVAAYAATGVQLISVGALTHSAPVFDIGLDLRLPS
ncbi:MAG: carboxylating nicotinate-nucleotide diphosphorylase [Acidimicrobiales bacterium]